jgi:hypothetical protein
MSEVGQDADRVRFIAHDAIEPRAESHQQGGGEMGERGRKAAALGNRLVDERKRHGREPKRGS